MLSLRDVRIDPSSLGEKLILVDVKPAYEYAGGNRTDKLLGYRYEVCLPEHRLEKLKVLIPGPQQLEMLEDFPEVLFADLEVRAYESKTGVQFTATATSIVLAR